jgi:hypothetical protein
MKNIFSIIAFFSIISVSAQKYVPFPTQHAQWNVYYGYSTNDAPMTYTILQYSLQGDTTINGVLYHKLCKNIGTVSSPVYQFAGGLREQDKKVYFYGFGYSEFNTSTGSYFEVMLYDFNKVEGETVYVRLNQLNYTIASVDSVKMGSDFRKRYKLNGSNEYVIEGVGNINGGLLGIVTPITTCSMCHRSWELMCFSQNGETVYKNPSFVDCISSLRVGIKDVKENQLNPTRTTLKPTYSQNFVTLQFTTSGIKCTKIEVSDLLGKQIQIIPITHDNEYRLDISGFNNGVYLIWVQYDDKTECHKFIKI